MPILFGSGSGGSSSCGTSATYSAHFSLTLPAQTGQSGNLTNKDALWPGNGYIASTANGGYSQASGVDVIFCTAATGGTQLPSEGPVTYNATTGAAEYWVQLPTVSNSVSETIYALVGNASPVNYSNPFTFTAGVSGTCVANETIQQATSLVTATLLTLSSPYTISNLSGVPLSGAGEVWTGQTSGCSITSTGGGATPVSVIWPSFTFVEHLGSSSSLVLTDSTEQYSFANDGATAVAGEIGGGAGFLASSSQYIASTQALNIQGSFSLEQWVANGNAGNAAQSWGGNTYTVPETSGVNSYVFLNGTDSCAVAACASIGYQSSDTFYFHNSAGSIGTSNAWHHVVGTHTTGTANLTTYLDGAVSNGAVLNSGSPTDPGSENTDWIWGRNGAAMPYYYTGSLDEMRAFKGVLSSDWILFDYNNQSQQTIGTFTAGSLVH